MRRRVAITGMGAVTPIGNDPDTFGESLLAGRSGARRITLFDPGELPTKIAAEVRWDGPLEGDRRTTFALEAGRQAIAAASACGSRPRGEGAVGLGIGLEVFSVPEMVEYRRPGFQLPTELGRRLRFLHVPAHLAAHVVSHRFGLSHPPYLSISTCAASADAVGAAFRAVASGRRDWMLAGGTDSMISHLAFAGFTKLCTLSARNDPPAEAPRPFDRSRDGFVMGEGAGMLVLEPLDAARARGARIYAEMIGFGCSMDAYGISEPHPEGRGAYQAMARALADAGLGTGDLDVINGHATGTLKNDPIETLAVKRLLGARAHEVPICATKSMIGHLIASAGVVEVVAAIQCMRKDMVHPTLNLHDPDPACDLDYVPLKARPHPTSVVMCNSFGFGGMNASLIFRKSPEA